jgi:hypothetical protein
MNRKRYGTTTLPNTLQMTILIVMCRYLVKHVGEGLLLLLLLRFDFLLTHQDLGKMSKLKTFLLRNGIAGQVSTRLANTEHL